MAGRRQRPIETAAAFKGQTLAPVHPNAGLELAFRRKLDAMIEDMHRSALYWITAAYRANEPEMAQDESPARALRKRMKALGRHWEKKFDQAAQDLASYFAMSAAERADDALMAILKKAGFAVKFKMSAAMNDIVQANVGQNVTLIKSIPAQYMTQVEGIVLRSVQAGGDIGGLRKALQEQVGVTKRRATLIARTQNSMATASITRLRQREIGITHAKWMHSGGGKHPRPSHLKAGKDGTVYEIAEGWFDPDEGKRIWPGELISCRCVSRPIIAALSNREKAS